MRLMLLLSTTILFFGAHAEAERQIQPSATIPAPVPTFQVATIKPSKPDEWLKIQIQGRRFATTGSSLVDILKYAYGIHASQIVDGPAWLSTEKFDLLADPDKESRPTSDEMKKMVQELVSDRFHLSFHRARRELPVYAIVVGKTAPKLTKSTKDPSGNPWVAFSPSGSFSVGNASMADLATFMQRYAMDRPVVDKTGIPGKYDLSLVWTPDDKVASTDDPNAPPGLFTAIQEQLGLKLEATRAQVDVFIIDHVEQPSEN
jgi:uncharacterized protein (TIGR03435 family)